MITLGVFLFFAWVVAYTGPAWEDSRRRRWRHRLEARRIRRQQLRDWPEARIVPIRGCQTCGRVNCPWHL